MKRFASLYQRLDRMTGTNDRKAALIDYFAKAPPADAAWALWLLSGRKLSTARNRLASTAELKAWIAQISATPAWLVEASHHAVGDLAETLALLLDDPVDAVADELPLAEWIESRLLPIANADEATRREVITTAWRTQSFAERLVFNKILTGALRIGVSQTLVQQALASSSGVPIARIAQRMLGDWTPSPEFLSRLLSDEVQPALDASAPYPFFLASPLDREPEGLGPPSEWLLEWKWDGIRLQLIRRAGQVALWSRGEERLDGRFPEIEQAAASLRSDAVIDGELLAWREGDSPLPFSSLQTRIQRLKPGPRALEQAPVRMLAYDLLEVDGEDLRECPLDERRARLSALLERGDQQGNLQVNQQDNAPRIALSPAIVAADWNEAAALRDTARARGVEGLMLKRRDSRYQHGRRRGDWWKWKIAPLTIDAVMLYAQAGHGRRSTLYTDYTFGVWNRDGETDVLVPIAKAYSGLADDEIMKLDRWIRANTLERFGPVRSVQPEQVFELAFEGVNRSTRHKSGVALRFPRILRWRHDKPAHEADRIESLQALAT